MLSCWLGELEVRLCVCLCGCFIYHVKVDKNVLEFWFVVRRICIFLRQWCKYLFNLHFWLYELVIDILSFHATGLILCSLETSEFPDVYTRYRKRSAAWNGLMILQWQKRCSHVSKNIAPSRNFWELAMAPSPQGDGWGNNFFALGCFTVENIGGGRLYGGKCCFLVLGRRGGGGKGSPEV